MTTYRITSPRSRTDRAADVLWHHLGRPHGAHGLTGVTTSEMVLIDCVRLRARKITPATRERIDSLLTEAGYAPLRWKIDDTPLRGQRTRT